MNAKRSLLLFPLVVLGAALHCVGDSTVNPPDGGSDVTTPLDSGDAETGSKPDADAAPPPPGTLEWVNVYTTDDPGDIVSDSGYVAVAADGTIAVLAEYSGPTQFGSTTLTPTGSTAPLFTLKLDKTGKVIWAKSIPNAGALIPAAIAVNAGGDAYVGFETGGGTITLDGVTTTDNSSGFFGSSLFKLAAADGKAQWAYGFGTSSSSVLVFVTGIAVHGTAVAVATYFQGQVQIVGTTTTALTAASSGRDALVTVHDDTQMGKVSIYKVLGGTGDDKITSIAADSAGALYIGGYFTTTMLGLTILNGGALNSFAARFDTTLTKTWAQDLGGFGATTNIGQPLALASDGTSVYIVGGLWGYTSFGASIPSVTSAGGEDGFLASLSASSGTVNYARNIGGAADDEAESVATGPSGFVAVSGQYKSTGVTIGATPLLAPQTGTEAAFVARAAGAGTYTWAKGVAGPNSADFVRATGVGIDPADGSVIAVGTFSGTVDFGDGVMRKSSAAGTHQAFYVVKYAP